MDIVIGNHFFSRLRREKHGHHILPGDWVTPRVHDNLPFGQPFRRPRWRIRAVWFLLVWQVEELKYFADYNNGQQNLRLFYFDCLRECAGCLPQNWKRGRAWLMKEKKFNSRTAGTHFFLPGDCKVLMALQAGEKDSNEDELRTKTVHPVQYSPEWTKL